MTDPISTGAGQVAEKMLEEVREAASQADQLAQQAQTPDVQFNQVMDAQRVGEIQEVRPGATDVLSAARVAQSQGAPAVPAVGRSLDRHRTMNSGVQRIMEDVMQGQNKLEEIMSLALSGRSFSTPELLALQAGVYRFTQELELTSKVVEKGTSTIKQTMNTQV
ncbi:MAG: hypothetical protein AAFZ18_02555 [Myxococcota bacterium]